MTNALATTTSVASLIPVADREFLAKTADSIRNLARNGAMNAIAIGSHLKLVHDRLPTHFDRWLETDTSWTSTAARKLMRAAEEFGVLSEAQLQHFDSTALLVLSAWSVKPEVRNKAIEMATGGEKISGTKAKQIIELYKNKAASPKMTEDGITTADVKAYFDERKEINKAFPDERPKIDAGDTESTLSWSAFKHLVDTGCRVHAERMLDTDGEDHPHASPWMVTVYPKDSMRSKKFTSSDGLEAAMLEAADRQPTRVCTGKCGKTLKLYSDFSRKDGATSGRASACKECEVIRVTIAKEVSKKSRFQILEVAGAGDGPTIASAIPERPNPSQSPHDGERTIRDQLLLARD